MNTKILDIIEKLPRETTLRELESWFIIMVLKKNGGNRTHTAKEIGMKLRTMRSRINEMKIEGYEVPSLPFQGRPKKPISETLDIQPQTNR